MIPRSRRPLLVATMLAVSLGCVSEKAPDVEPTTVSAYLGSASPRSLSMIAKTDRGSEIFAVQLTDSLVQYDPQMRLVPRLAERWELSADRRGLVFHLRPGVRWHDGRPVTADDVVFSARTAREPGAENRSYGPALEAVREVRALDPRTVLVTYDEAQPSALAAWRLPIVPAHLAPDGIESLLGPFAEAPVGCGPFRFVSHTREQEIALEANDDYWDGRPAIDRLVLRIYSDQRTAVQALLDGELQLATVTPEWYERVVDGPEAGRFAAFVYFSMATRYIAWNQSLRSGLFDDARVRRALVMALDRRGFNERLVQGIAREGVGVFHPASAWTDPEIKPWPYDPDEARRLLGEAGWIDSDGDGVRERNGTALRFSLIYPRSSQALADQLAAWQQQSWREVGAEVEVERLEWNAFLDRRASGAFGVATASLSFTPDPDDVYALLHSSARKSGMNFFGFVDAEVDRLLDAARRTFDEDERLRLYHALQRRLHELEPLTIPFYFPSPVVHDRRLTGVTPTPLDFWRTTAGPRLWRWNADGS